MNRMETESFVETKFTPVTAHERRAFQTRDGFVRYLGSFEHLHWLVSQTGPRAFAHAIEVTGATTVEQWRSALDALQQSQPFFSVQIYVDSNNRPYFRRVDGAPIPMRVLDAKLSTNWEVELGKEVSTVVAANQAPLLPVLIHESERSTFIMTAHHSISDGVSMREALCDLVRALSGQQFDRRSVLPSQKSRLGSHYDFIVCGAGPSGSVVLARLAADLNTQVLLLEAGGTDDTHLVTNPNRWPMTLGSELDWGFVTEPNPNLNGRAIRYSMGKVLGRRFQHQCFDVVTRTPR